MSRPIYEKAQDRANELDVATRIAAAHSLNFCKLPRAYAADYAFLREGRCVIVAEVKCRTNAADAYPTYMLSVLKRYSVRQLAYELHARPLLVVRFTDALLHINLNEEPDSIAEGGRTDRNDSQDVELVCHYGMHRLTPIPNVEV
jgi:hypothetical protein